MQQLTEIGLYSFVIERVVEYASPLLERYGLSEYRHIIAGLLGVIVAVVFQVEVGQFESLFANQAFGAFILAVGTPLLHDAIRAIQAIKEFFKDVNGDK